MPGGRPKTDVIALLQKHHDTLVAQSKKGGTKSKIALTLGISKETLYTWMKENKEFSDAIEQYMLTSQAHWEHIAYRRASGDLHGGSDAMAKFMMSNIFRDEYATERTENTNKNETRLDVKAADEILRQYGIDANIDDGK